MPTRHHRLDRDLGQARQPGPIWPGWRDLTTFLVWGALVGVVFLAVYPASNWLTAQRTGLWHLHLEGERSIPFVPQAVWLYLSMYLLFALPPFFVPAPAAACVGKQLMAGCIVSGGVFLLVPAALGFERVIPPEAPYRQIFQAMYGLDAPHNLVPSLHVVFSCVIALACASYARAPFAWLLRVWLVAIVVSTVLVHQHHLIDVAAALLLVGVLRWRWQVG